MCSNTGSSMNSRVAQRLGRLALPLAGFFGLITALGIVVQRARTAEHRFDAIAAALTRAAHKASAGQPSVAMLFGPADCATSLDAIDDLNELAESGRASVTGLLLEVDTTHSMAAQIANANGIRFSVTSITSPSGLALTKLLRVQTPVVFVLDTDGGIRRVLDGHSVASMTSLERMIEP